jgi:hypothetical protein
VKPSARALRRLLTAAAAVGPPPRAAEDPVKAVASGLPVMAEDVIGNYQI